MKPNRETYPNKTWISGDDNALFPRCQHPDTRPNHVVLKLLRERFGRKTEIKHDGKWYPCKSTRPYRRNMIPVKCLETGIVYPSYRDACADLNLNIYSMSKHLNGYSSQSHVSGYHFIRLENDRN